MMRYISTQVKLLAEFDVEKLQGFGSWVPQIYLSFVDQIGISHMGQGPEGLQRHLENKDYVFMFLYFNKMSLHFPFYVQDLLLIMVPPPR